MTIQAIVSFASGTGSTGARSTSSAAHSIRCVPKRLRMVLGRATGPGNHAASATLRETVLPQLNVRLMYTFCTPSIGELDSNSNSSTTGQLATVVGSLRGLFWTSLKLRHQEHLRMDFKSLIHRHTFTTTIFHFSTKPKQMPVFHPQIFVWIFSPPH